MIGQAGPRPTGTWFARLTGDALDLAECERSLKAPFDPWCERILRNGDLIWALRSSELSNSPDADAARAVARPLVDRLNGALIVAGFEPLKFDGVGHVDAQGGIKLFVSGEAHAFARATMAAVGQVSDAAGNIVEPPEPQASLAQRWVRGPNRMTTSPTCSFLPGAPTIGLTSTRRWRWRAQSRVARKGCWRFLMGRFARLSMRHGALRISIGMHEATAFPASRQVSAKRVWRWLTW